MNIKSIKAFKGLRKVSNTSNNQDGYFSELVNLVKDAKGRLHPYYQAPFTEKAKIPWFAEQGNTFLAIRYKKGVLRLDFARHVNGNEMWEVRPYFSRGKDYVNHPLSCKTYNFCDASKYYKRKDGNSFSHAEVDMNLFINKIVVDRTTPSNISPVIDSGVYKFDGEKFHRGGLPTPWNHFTSNPGLIPTNTAKYILVYITPDFNGGMTISDYSEMEVYTLPMGLGSLAYNLDFDQEDFVGVDNPSPVAGTAIKKGIYPKSRDVNNKFQEFLKFSDGPVKADYPDAFLFISPLDVLPQAGGDWIEITKDLGETNISRMDSDGWLIANFMFLKVQVNGEDVFLRGDRYDSFAFYIRPNLYTDKIWVSKKARAYNSQTLMWEEINLFNFNGGEVFDVDGEYKTFSKIVGSNSLFDSTTDWVGFMFSLPLAQTFIGYYCYDGGVTKEYLLDRFAPLCPGSGLTFAFDAVPAFNPDLDESFNDTKRPILGQITYYFSDWYSTEVKKVQFPPLTSITNYKNLLVGCDDNAIYFSHTGLGGSLDMTSGEDNLVPPGTSFGKLVGVCGSEEFLFISRERKNYVLTGDLVSGGFIIQECNLPVAGMATATSAINAFNNRIIFLNREGVWEVTASGAIRSLSSDISDLFNPLEPNNIRDWVKDELYGYTTRVAMSINTQEALLYIVLHKSEISTSSTPLPENMESPLRKILTLNLLDMTWGEVRLPDINGYAIHQSPEDDKTAFFGKDNIYKRNFVRSAPVYQQARFDWMADGSQALDKKIAQLKFYGPIQNAANITLKHWVDWKKDPITNVKLTKETGDTYQREKKLNQSISKVYSFELSTTNGGIVLDQVDVEGQMIQESIKSTRRKNQND